MSKCNQAHIRKFQISNKNSRRPKCILSCNIDVRQGDNLSPLLFTVFLNDLEQYLDQHTHGINVDYIDDDIVVLFKLFILLYADGTLNFAENPEEQQQSLNAFQKFCEL